MMVSFLIFIYKKILDCLSCRHSLWPLLDVLFHFGVSLWIGSLVSVCSSVDSYQTTKASPFKSSLETWLEVFSSLPSSFIVRFLNYIFIFLWLIFGQTAQSYRRSHISILFKHLQCKFQSLLLSMLSITHDSDILSKKAGTPEWHQIFLRGIGCNWLVCIAIWVRHYYSVIVRKLNINFPMSSKR